jgi:multiple sugar transport system ATP-binding protein
VNLFVAGFIGSPAMNFMPASVEGDTVKLPFGDVRLPGDLHGRVKGSEGKQLIAGIRPEHFEDASLVGDPDAPGVTFKAPIDVIEWMGAELFVHFVVEGSAHQELRDLAEELETVGMGPNDEAQIVARLDIHSEAKEGQETELWLDSRKVLLFDADSGENLTREATSSARADAS